MQVKNGVRGRRRSSRNIAAGFTLIELLVVIGIIALLIAILLPALQRARAEARKITCSSTMRQWGTAASAYAGDWRDEFPGQYEDTRYAYRLAGEMTMTFATDYIGVDLIRDAHADGTGMEITYCPTVTRWRTRGVWRPNWAPEREYLYLGFLWWPAVSGLRSSSSFYVDTRWHTRDRFNTAARDAPIMGDIWQHQESSDPFNDIGGPGILEWNAHRNLSGDDDHPGGVNGLREDGSVRWTDAADVLPGHDQPDHDHGHFRYNVPDSRLQVYPDGDAADFAN